MKKNSRKHMKMYGKRKMRDPDFTVNYASYWGNAPVKTHYWIKENKEYEVDANEFSHIRIRDERLEYYSKERGCFKEFSENVSKIFMNHYNNWLFNQEITKLIGEENESRL